MQYYRIMLIKPNNKINNRVNNELLRKYEHNDADFLYDDTSKIVCFGMKKNTFIKRLLLLFIPGGLLILIFYEDICIFIFMFPIYYIYMFCNFIYKFSYISCAFQIKTNIFWT